MKWQMVNTGMRMKFLMVSLDWWTVYVQSPQEVILLIQMGLSVKPWSWLKLLCFWIYIASLIYASDAQHWLLCCPPNLSCEAPPVCCANPSYSKTLFLYGLPKLHKQGVPLHPIVSTIGSATYQLAKCLTTIISPLAGQITSFVRSSAHFTELLKQISVTEEEIMVSFDVSSPRSQ